MTEELRGDLIQLSIPKFLDFYLRQPHFGGPNRACAVLEMLRDLSQVSPLFYTQVFGLILMG